MCTFPQSKVRFTESNFPLILQGSNSKATSGKLAITSVALQDHIARNLLLQNLSLCDPVKTRWCRRAATETHCKRNHGTVKQKGPQQHNGEEKEYVLDPAAPPLTLGKLAINQMYFIKPCYISSWELVQQHFGKEEVSL